LETEILWESHNTPNIKNCEVANPQQIESMSDVNEQQIFFLMNEKYPGRDGFMFENYSLFNFF
jgi:hypothetical protein